MDCLVSGLAGRVVFIEGNDISYIEADEPEERISSSSAAIPYLLAGAHDVVRLERTDETKALQCLLRLWNSDRALRMLQTVLDATEDLEDRTEAADFLSNLLNSEEVCESLKNWTYAIPVFSEIATAEIEEEFDRWPNVVEFVKRLEKHQEEIERFRAAWDAIRDDYFADEIERKRFELTAVESGAFRRLAEAGLEPGQINTAILECHFALSSMPGSRQIIIEWTKDFAEKRTRRRLKRQEIAIVDYASIDLFKADHPERLDQSHESYQTVLRQQEGIRTQLAQGKIHQARRFAKQLVDWQLTHGGPLFAAKSLCALAQEAKRLGQHSLQLEWTLLATQVAPDDAWSHGQAGDAYLMLYRLEEARRCYETAGELGDEPFAATGTARVLRASGRLDEALEAFERAKKDFREHGEAIYAWVGYAEVFRDMWRLEEALEAYNAAVDQFPDESSAWCGRAATLKDMGRLEEAEESYNRTLERFPDDAVAFGGRADVLKNLGELDQALALYDDAIARFPTEPVLMCGKADVLGTMGRFEDALTVYADAMRRFPYEAAAFSGYAEVLRDSDHLDEALAAYDDAIRTFRFDIRCRNGRANVLRVFGRFEDALQAYDQNVKDFPYDLYALSGRANLLKELGRYEHAIDAYDDIIQRRPDYEAARCSKAAILVISNRFEEAEVLLSDTTPKTRTEWIAFHIRGMIYLKTGRLDQALEVFNKGVLFNPFFKERNYFENALAAAKIRENEFKEAARMVKNSTSLISYILQIHSFSELGLMEDAAIAYRAVNDNSSAPIINLRDELAAQYRIINQEPLHDKQWILDQEVEVLLQAA